MCFQSKTISGYLLLEDGTVVCGTYFGADTEAHGEVGKLFKFMKVKLK